jgi:putative endopeptidase
MTEQSRLQDDFYQHINNEWLNANPIPGDYSKWGTFEVLVEENNKRVQELLDLDDSYDQDWTKLRTLWLQGTNDQFINSKPLNQTVGTLIDQIMSISTLDDLQHQFMNNMLMGTKGPLDLEASTDLKDSSTNILYVDRNGLGLPDRDYYFVDTMLDKKNAYKEFLLKLLTYVYAQMGYDNSNLSKIAENVYNLEEQLASTHLSQVERRDPYNLYNIYTFEELFTKYPNLNWTLFFNSVNQSIMSNKKIGLTEPTYFQKLNELVDIKYIDTWKAFLLVRFATTFAPYLEDELNNIQFDFYGKVMCGQQEQKPRWKRVLRTIDSTIGQLIGKKYCEKYFTNESKQCAIAMIQNMIEIMKERMQKLTWLTNETKQKAIHKLEGIVIKIGFPDKWDQFDSLVSSNSSYCDNVMNCLKWSIQKNLNKAYNPVDKLEWFMQPYEVNAYYNPTQNEIVFPAGILQAPFFDKNAEPAQNYGGIGAVICHEITHGFDDQGMKYDSDGNLNNWWSSQDIEQYSSLTDKMKVQFDNVHIDLIDMNINGSLTLGENIADFGGLTIALNALQNFCSHNSTDFNVREQMDLFFKSWALIWRNNIKHDELKRRIILDPHSPGMYRVNCILQNVPEFYDMYDIKNTDKMYLDHSLRSVIW